MKFIIASIGFGAALILGPIAHHAYYTSQFTKIIPAILQSQGSVSFAELPAMCYAFADGTGLLLIVAAFIVGARMSLMETKAKLDRKAAQP
jgi:hypothetical protein